MQECLIRFLLPSQLPKIWVAKCGKPVWLQIRNRYVPELQQVTRAQWLKMLRCIFHHVVLLLAPKPSIITAEIPWNDSPRPSHYRSLNSTSSIFCIIPDSQLSTLCRLQNQEWTCNTFHLQCLSNSNRFLFIMEPLFRKDYLMLADDKRRILKDPSHGIPVVVEKRFVL